MTLLIAVAGEDGTLAGARTAAVGGGDGGCWTQPGAPWAGCDLAGWAAGAPGCTPVEAQP